MELIRKRISRSIRKMINPTKFNIERATQVDGNKTIVQVDSFDCQRDVVMGTCEKLIPEESFEYFIGDIKSDYINLINDLDQDSIETVVRIISRIHGYKKHNINRFWLTLKEREELLSVYDANSSNILQLSEDCYAYGKYLLPRRIISPTVFYYRHFLYEVKNIDNVKSKNIIDVGGFIGDSALILSEYTDRNVHIFEPVTELHSLLLKTVEMNGLKNVVINKSALGAECCELSINIAGDNSTLCTNDHVKSYNCKQEVVKVTTLDSYVQEYNLEVGLIKVDIEGFEQKFLEGARFTIESQKPVLMMSIYHNADDFFHIKTIIESWNLGYKFRIVKPADKTIIIDTNLIAEVR
jgi:FkbM family methyltransferase